MTTAEAIKQRRPTAERKRAAFDAALHGEDLPVITLPTGRVINARGYIDSIRGMLDALESSLGAPTESGVTRTGRHTGLTEAIGEILAEGPKTAPEIREELIKMGVPFTSNALSVYLTRRFRRLGNPPNSQWVLKPDTSVTSRSRQKGAASVRTPAE